MQTQQSPKQTFHPTKQTKISDFIIHHKLGEGAFSSVYKVTRKSDKQFYAMKKVKMNKLTEREKINAVNEVRILASLNDSNIIGYKEAFYDEYSQCLCIVQEFAEGGDMMSLISQNQKRKTYFSEEQIWQWGIQMIKGLKSLHDMNIMHRDIKSANVFLQKDKRRVMLGDLNVSKVTKRNQMAYTQTGTPYYAAPEIWKDSPYNNKCDIWSVGCVLYEICSSKPPFRAQNMEGLYRKIQKGSCERIPMRYSQELQNFIAQCMQLSPSIRPGCEQLLKLPSVVKRLNNLDNLSTEQSSPRSSKQQSELISTIRVPKNLRQLKDRLPKATYQSQNDVIIFKDPKLNQISPQRSQSIENSSGVRSGSRGLIQRKQVLQQQQQQQQQQKALQPIDLNQYNIKVSNNNLKQNSSVQYMSRNRAGSLQTYNKQNSNVNLTKQSPGQQQQRKMTNCGSNVSQKENILPNIPLVPQKSSQEKVSQTPQVGSNQQVKIIQYQNQRNHIRLRSSDPNNRKDNSSRPVVRNANIFQDNSQIIKQMLR